MDDTVSMMSRVLAARDDVVFAYLFGSRARGAAHPRSDVDVAVWLGDARDEWPLLGLATALTEVSGRARVDVVILNDAPAALAFEALKGVLLVSKDDDARVEAEGRIMARYHDRRPYLQRSLDAAMERIRERGLS